MQTVNSQLVVIIIAVLLVLLVFGVLFLVMLSYFNNKKIHAAREKQVLKDAFEKQLMQSRLEIQDQTFNSISQEIHDNVGQTLSLAKVQVNIIGESGALNSELLKDVKDSISLALTDLRDIAKSLSSERIQQVRLPELIQSELLRIRKIGLTQTVLEVEGTEREVGYREKLILYRIVQESLQNIVKHAEAREIRGRIAYGEDRLEIDICDDGKGFVPEVEKQKGSGLGLANIINRASLINGHAAITSAPNEGTQIIIIIPYD